MTDEKVLAARDIIAQHIGKSGWAGTWDHMTSEADALLAALHDAGWTLVRQEGLDAAWAEAEAALPLTGWPDPIDGRWVIPNGTWAIDIRREQSGDGYFEPAVDGYWATAKVNASPRPYAVRGDLGPTPAEALRALARVLRGDDQ